MKQMLFPPIDSRTANSLWGSVLAETLVRSGVRQAVVSPGSRSTPLTLALAENPQMEAIAVLDERSAGFFALGLARQQLKPVLLVCTSGTAAANYLPAIIEAKESGVPLLVVTADRPPEMRACASGQTVDQQKLYGSHVNFYHELSVPEANEPLLRYLRQTVAHACARTCEPFAGPVHLNAPFRDPLVPAADKAIETFAATVNWEHFFSHVRPPSLSEPVAAGPEFAAGMRGIIVAGPAQPSDPASYVTAAGEIARRLGWPVLADGLSPARNYGGRIPNLITAYDAILRNPTAAEELRPEAVLCLGGWPTSKVLRAWLETSSAPTWLVSTRPDNRDPLHGSTQQIAIPLRLFASALPQASRANSYEQLWRGHEARVRAGLDARLRAEELFFEPKVAWLLAHHLPEETPLFIASSMPVRDVEYIWPAGDRRIRPLFNRGANGIDGTLSTALGVAHGNRPAVLLTGDLALLHDTNGFLLRPKFRGSLTVILVNNRGGGIFEHLPVAGVGPHFEEFFATPQEIDFATLCAAYGAGHVLVKDWAQLTELISKLPASGIRVLEVRTDRKRDAAMRKQLFAEVANPGA